MEVKTIVLNNSIFIDLQEKIGEGSFGIVRRGIVRDMKESVAVKLEAEKNSPKGELLLNEANVLRELQSSRGVPIFYYHGVWEDHHFVVMQLLGPSLNTRMRQCRRKLSLHTTLMLLEQMVLIIEHVHKAGFAYRDIKPHNFLFGLAKRSQDLFLIDYGLAKKLSQGFTNSHTTVLCKGFSGTLPFISLNAHLGVKCARRDDLESIGYLAIYMQLGRLPWFTHTHEPTERETRVSKQNFDSTLRKFNLPDEFRELIAYSRSLKFDEIPDYAMIRAKFRALADRNRLMYRWVYDWDMQIDGESAWIQARKRFKSTTLAIEQDEELCISSARSVSSTSIATTSQNRSKSVSRSNCERVSRKGKRKRTLVMKFCGFKHREALARRLSVLKTTEIKERKDARETQESDKKESCVVV